MDYGSIIKRAWHITWRYKALWVLGVFAGVSGCQGGGGGGGSGGGNSFSDGLTAGKSPMGGVDSLKQFTDSLVGYLPALIAGGILLVFVGLLWSVFAVAARGGLVAGVNAVEDGRPAGVGALWSAGFRRFWTLVGLDILLKLPVVAVTLLMLVGIIAPIVGALSVGSEPGAEVIAPICGSLVIGVPVLIVLSFVLGVMYLIALRYVMLGGQGAIEAAGNSWRFFRARFKDTFLIWLINAGLNIAASLVLAIPAVLIGVGIAIPAIAIVASESWGALAPLVVVGLLLIIALSLVYSAIWGTYTSALWTLFFRRVAGMEPAVVASPAVVQPPGYGYQPPAPPLSPAEPCPLTPPQPPESPSEAPWSPAHPPAPPSGPDA